jgi:hypothetical protein
VLYPADIEDARSAGDGGCGSDVFDEKFIFADPLTYLHDCMGAFAIFCLPVLIILFVFLAHVMVISPDFSYRFVLHLDSVVKFRCNQLAVFVNVGIIAAHVNAMKRRTLIVAHIGIF